MVKMSQEIQDAITQQGPTPLATANADGTPNVIFIGIKQILDDETILFADNFFNKTLANLKENPKLSFVVLVTDSDGKPTASYQIKGSVEILTSGSIYDDMVKMVHAKNPALPAKSSVILHVEEIYNALFGPDAGAKIA